MGTVFPQTKSKTNTKKNEKMSTKTESIKVRVSEKEKEELQRAAALSGQHVSELMLVPALDRARQIVAELSLSHVTVMPRSSFDALMASLDEPDEVTEANIEAVRRLRDDDAWDLD